MPKYTPGRAPRGGEVDIVVRNRTKNSNPNNGDPWLPGNVLRVMHQGGDTWSWYEHMLPGIGVLPEVGDIIERGDTVIVVDNTGNSTGSHLHYHVTRTGDRGGTIQIRFEGIRPLESPTVLSCVIPGEGFWISTNVKPSS
jgi:murein DD-endopeptidase MepM/ murein hydrolase activator NlpD